MGDGSSIEWLQRPGTKPASWNPIRAYRYVTDPVTGEQKVMRGWYCEHVHDGCINCYAERQNIAAARGGTGLPYKPGHRKDAMPVLDEDTLIQPIKWKSPRTVFPCSMTDLFGEWVSDEWLDRIFAIMGLCSQHTFIVLTKRPERMRRYIAQAERRSAKASVKIKPLSGGAGRQLESVQIDATEGWGVWPLPNVWLVVSCSRQEDADKFVPILLSTPAAVRGVSAEPLLESLSLMTVAMPAADVIANTGGLTDIDESIELAKSGFDVHLYDLGGIDWVTIGGESGPKAREFRYSWARQLLSDGRRAFGWHKCFVKQMGSNAIDDLGFVGIGHEAGLHDRKGGNPQEWPGELQVRQWPAVRP